jgi:excisionase family DNA binding protein
MKTLEPLLTVKETAKLLNTCEKTVRRRITEGELPVIRDGRTVRIHPADLERYIRARRHG